jgi:hypothetical protein
MWPTLWKVEARSRTRLLTPSKEAFSNCGNVRISTVSDPLGTGALIKRMNELHF